MALSNMLAPVLLKFQDASLNEAIAHLRFFRDQKNEWFHTVVPKSLYTPFMQRIRDANDAVHISTYACYCATIDPETRHQHLLLVSTAVGFFEEQVWIEGVHTERIQSAVQFIKIIGKLSQLKKQRNLVTCPSSDPRMKRVHCSVTLPRNYDLILALQWDDGVWQLLHRDVQKKKLNLKAIQWNTVTKRVPYNRLRVLPVAKHFQPCAYRTAYFLHLDHGRKLYFERCKSRLSHRAWLRKQFEKGNIFHYEKGKKLVLPNTEYLGQRVNETVRS